MRIASFFWTVFLIVAPILSSQAEFASSPEAVRPILLGTQAPNPKVQDLDGNSLGLSELLSNRPTVLVFYRGGWCPYCQLQLSELRHLVPQVNSPHVQWLALSPDAPEVLKASVKGEELRYRLLSDADANAIQAFGIAFRLDDTTHEKYQGYGIDLEKTSGGRTHRALPVPSVFVIDSKGVVQFSYVNPDYRTRIPARLIKAAIEAVVAGEAGKPLR